MNATARTRLCALLGERATMGADILAQHGRGEAYHPDSPPEMVVFPTSTEEVSAIAAICSEHGVAMIPFGAARRSRATCWRLRRRCVDLQQ